MKYIFSMTLHIYVTIVNTRCPNVRKAIHVQDFWVVPIAKKRTSLRVYLLSNSISVYVWMCVDMYAHTYTHVHVC